MFENFIRSYPARQYKEGWREKYWPFSYLMTNPPSRTVDISSDPADSLCLLCLLTVADAMSVTMGNQKYTQPPQTASC